MKQEIKTMLEEAMPMVDFDSDYLFSELDSLSITTIMMMLGDKYGVKLESNDGTPKNLRSLDSIVSLVESKMKNN